MYSLCILHYTIKQDRSKQTYLKMSSFSTCESRKSLSSGQLSIVWRIYLGLSVYTLNQPLTQMFPADCQYFLKTKKTNRKMSTFILFFLIPMRFYPDDLKKKRKN